MSIQIMLRLRCDGCGSYSGAEPDCFTEAVYVGDIAAVRRRARSIGWGRRSRELGGIKEWVDLCPACLWARRIQKRKPRADGAPGRSSNVSAV